MTEELDFRANDKKERALSLINAIRHNIFNAIYQMQKLRDEELYKELGYNSLSECLEAELNIKRTTIFKYEKIMDRFLLNASNSNQSGMPNIPAIPAISTEKLLILSRLSKEQTTRLLTEGKMNIRGKEYSIEKINQTPRNELKRIMAGKSANNFKAAEQRKTLLENEKRFYSVFARMERDFNKIVDDLDTTDWFNDVEKKMIKKNLYEAYQYFDIYKNNLDALNNGSKN